MEAGEVRLREVGVGQVGPAAYFEYETRGWRAFTERRGSERGVDQVRVCEVGEGEIGVREVGTDEGRLFHDYTAAEGHDTEGRSEIDRLAVRRDRAGEPRVRQVGAVEAGTRACRAIRREETRREKRVREVRATHLRKREVRAEERRAGERGAGEVGVTQAGGV